MAKKVAKKAVKKTARTAAKSTVKKATKVPAKKAVKKTASKKATTKKTPTRKAAPKAKAAARKVTAKPKASARKPKAPKCPLTKAELKELHAMLIEKRVDLVGDMNGIHFESLGGAGDLSNMPTHPADIGSDNFEQEFTLGLLESERQLLTDINEALERIDSGTYGICMGTGGPIGLPRLKARPWAKYSIEYARLIEQGLVHPDEDNDITNSIIADDSDADDSDADDSDADDSDADDSDTDE